MKRLMKFSSRLVLLVVISAGYATPAAAESLIFEGPWHTTNRKLDGKMTCIVNAVGEGKWRGRFYGIWQGVSFDYTVSFTGTPTNLQGTATIDGADYTWRGAIEQSAAGSPRVFKGVFGGDRYAGHFELKELPVGAVLRK